MTELAKNQIHRVVISGCTSEGQGVARIDGRAVFVAGALEGEECDIRILRAAKGAVWAKIERLIAPSPHRIEPDCPVYSACGGCDFRHVSYGEELNIKRRRVDDAMARIGGLGIRCERIIASPLTERYRNKVIFNIGQREGRAVAGFYRPRSHDIIPVPSCLLQKSSADAAARVLCAWMDEFGVPAYDELTGEGVVRRLFVRDAGQGVCVCVIAARALPHSEALTARLREAVPEIKSVVLNLNTTRGNTVLSGDFRVIWGDETVPAELCSLRFELSPRSFFQVNTPQAETLYAVALEYAALSGGETLLDLYCGTGTIGLCAAAKAGRVVGAEIVAAAIEDAKKNALRNGIKNAEFICADAAEAAARFKSEGLAPDVIIVDPPRKGLAPEVIASAAEMAPKRIVYVSCDPATLARDLKLFAGLGYAAQRLTAVDMFPRTSHVEVVSLLQRMSNTLKKTITLDVDMEDYHRIKSEGR